MLLEFALERVDERLIRQLFADAGQLLGEGIRIAAMEVCFNTVEVGIAGLLRGADDPLENALAGIQGDAPDELVEAIRLVPDLLGDEHLDSSGYVVDTLQTALYDALTADSAEEAIVTAVNRGGDADTFGAVTGALAGARFGSTSLPTRWLNTIEYEEDLGLLGRALATTDIEASV